MAKAGEPNDRLGDLEALYRAEFQSLVRLALLLVGDRSIAEELAQEAFVRIFPRLDELKEPGGYLQVTLVNLCRDHQRRQATQRRRPAARQVVVEAPHIPRAASEIWRALQRLPDRQREALVLRFYADLVTDDIARLLNARAGTVRSLIHRGLKTLKDALEGDPRED
jgi:RNA polymerase sigma factor (sigma-70 family)